MSIDFQTTFNIDIKMQSSNITKVYFGMLIFNIDHTRRKYCVVKVGEALDFEDTKVGMKLHTSGITNRIFSFKRMTA